MSIEYDNYIRDHKENLMRGLEWMAENLGKAWIDPEKMYEAMANAELHDESKYSKEEYDAYDAYFYGTFERSPKVQSDFDRAWLHHIHLNPHHWQHWVLLEDDPNLGSFGKVLDMPEEYIYEMIADWWTFSWRNNNLMEIFKWYSEHRDRIMMSDRTRLRTEQILKRIYDILRMQLLLSGNDEIPTYLFIDYVADPRIYERVEDTENLAHGEELSDEELKKRKYAFPEERKFPMPDKRHVRSAIRFFNYVDPKDEETLANAILARMKEYGMKLEDLNVGDENRFKNYIPEKEDAE